MALLIAAALASAAEAGSLRLTREAVVVGDVVRVEDVCALRSFDVDRHAEIATIEVGEAPAPGGRRFVHIDLVRDALHRAGINTAELTFGGFVECTVSRPVEPVLGAIADENKHAAQSANPARAGTGPHQGGPSNVGGRGRPLHFDTQGRPLDPHVGHTLRDAIAAFFDQSLARFDGEPVLTFDRASQSSLDLSGPEFSFDIRKTRGGELGLVSLSVQVIEDGAVVQEVPMVVHVRMNRRVLVARRAINQDAVISEEDVRLMRMTFDRVEHVGVADASLVVGQRSRSFVPVGAVIRMEDIEPVALVSRGELVDLFARTGGVEIRTSARAMAGGGLGDVIRVRDLNHKRNEFDAVVVGPGRVRIGGPRGDATTLRVAGGGNR